MVADAVATADAAIDIVGLDDVAAYLSNILAQVRALPDEALHTRRFRIAGQSISARFSDRERASLYASRLPPAEDHPALSDSNFHVDVVETTHLGWPAPALLKVPNGDRRAFERTLERAGLRAVPPFSSRLWDVMDRSGNRAIQLSQSRRDYPEWDGGAPLRIALHWAALDRGLRLIHGASLGHGDTAVLITGPGGAGKSGTVLAGIAHGLRTVGDDYVVIEPGDPPIAWQAYRLLKQDDAGIARLPGLADRIVDRRLNWQGKLEIDPESLFPGCLDERQTIRAIVVPKIDGASRSVIEPIDHDQAFDALARSTLQQFPAEQASGFLFCKRLARSLPCFGMSLSRDPGDVATTLQAFLEGLSP